jgi:hypothetical protein
LNSSSKSISHVDTIRDQASSIIPLRALELALQKIGRRLAGEGIIKVLLARLRQAIAGRRGPTTPWPGILANCQQLLATTREREAGNVPVPHRRIRPEAAFRITLARSDNCETAVKHLVGGIPGRISCAVHCVAPRLSANWRPPDPAEQPIGVLIRGRRREDLFLFYRARDAGLVFYTLPDEFESRLMLVPLQDGGRIKQISLRGNALRGEFSALEPGSYLVISFALIDFDALQREALVLREEGNHPAALALLEQVLEADPEDFLALTRKAFVLRAFNRSKDAMAAVEQALRIEPKFALAWRAKGALLRDDSQHRAGLECYVRSLALDPCDYLCWENKGNALMALGRATEAREAYAEAEEVKEHYPEPKY